MRIATSLLLLAILWPPLFWLTRSAAAQAPAVPVAKPPLGSQVVSLICETPKGKQVGTAFFVSQDGYLATSYNNVRNATSATIVSYNNTSGTLTLPVTGAVVVRKSQDLVILATEPKNPMPVPNFDPKTELTLQSPLLPQPGPRSKPLLNLLPLSPAKIAYLPHLQGKASGEDFLSGLKNDGPVGLGTDPALEWLILDVPVDLNYAGAPVWNESLTTVVGIVSSAGDGTPGLRYVLPIKYVLDLIPRQPPALIPFQQLAKWEDPKQLPPAPDAVNLAVKDSAARWSMRVEKREKLETHLKDLQQLKLRFGDEARTAATELQLASHSLSAMRPTEKIKTGTKRIKSETKNGKDKEEPEYRYEYSAAQKVEIDALRSKIVREQQNMLVSTLHSGMIDKNLRPHTQRRFGEATLELFLAADPLELRDLAELDPLQKRLDEKIQQGSLEPLDYLLRAVILTRQRKGTAAKQDLTQMVRLDPQFTPLRVVLEHRLDNFENKKQISAPRQTHKSPLLDLLVPLLAARIEWDNGDRKEAVAILTKWLPAHQRHADVHMALAWEMLEIQPATAETNRLALQYAWDAVELNRGRDWLALGSLAAVQVRGKDYLGAQETMTYLAPLMPPEQQKLLAAWQKAVADKKEPARGP